MEQLHLNEGQMCQIEYTNLPSATFAKFKPQSTDFLNISNPRAMLEVELRKFACLTKNDILSVLVRFVFVLRLFALCTNTQSIWFAVQ